MCYCDKSHIEYVVAIDVQVLFLISVKHLLEVDCCGRMGAFFQEM